MKQKERGDNRGNRANKGTKMQEDKINNEEKVHNRCNDKREKRIRKGGMRECNKIREREVTRNEEEETRKE